MPQMMSLECLQEMAATVNTQSVAMKLDTLIPVKITLKEKTKT